MTQQLINSLTEYLQKLGIENANISFQVPKQKEHGDLSTNLAMIYAKNLNNIIFEGANMAAGVNFNLYQIGFVSAGKEISSYPDQNLLTDKTTFGLDLGVTYDFSKKIRLAFVYKNLVQPNFSLFKSQTDNKPPSMIFSAAWRYGNLFGLEDASIMGSYLINPRSAGDNRKTKTSTGLDRNFISLTTLRESGSAMNCLCQLLI